MVEPERSESLAGPLLARLRDHLACPALEYAEAPTRLFGGNHTFVHGLRLAGAEPPWDAPLVVRVLRAHRAADEVVFETALQNALAPLAPRVLLHDTDATALGGAFQVMERVPGGALLMQEIRQEVGQLNVLREVLRGLGTALFAPWPEQMGEAHARLHGLPVEPVIEALDAVGMAERVTLAAHLARLEAEIAHFGAEALRPAHAWLRERAAQLTEPFSVCHGDLFPNQIFAADGEVTHVIDFAGALVAPGSLDVGYTCAGIEMIPFPIPGSGALKRRLARRFRRAYAARRPIDPEAHAFGEVLRAFHAVLNHARYDQGVEPAPVPYDSPRGLRLLKERLTRHGAG